MRRPPATLTKRPDYPAAPSCLAAIAMAANMTVEQLALVPFSFPTYANALGRAAIKTARQLDTHSSPEDRFSHAAQAATLAG